MIGYSIGEKYRQNYYATEAVVNLIQYAFTHLKMEKLIANTEKGNLPSKGLLFKLGFVNKTEDYLYSRRYDYFEIYNTSNPYP